MRITTDLLDTCLIGDCRKVMPTQPFEDAHFATFPPKLIEPCILAGSRPGDIVLDPFLGSGTTAEVAQGLRRRWLGIELNSDYTAMQRRRGRWLEFADTIARLASGRRRVP